MFGGFVMSPDSRSSVFQDKAKTSTVLLSLLLLFTLALAACGGGTTHPTATAQKTVLRGAPQYKDLTPGGFYSYNTPADEGICLVYEAPEFVDGHCGGRYPRLA